MDIDINMKFETIHCCICGFIFAVPKRWKNERREDSRNFSCVACGQLQHFERTTEEQRLRKMLDKERQRCLEAHNKADFFAKQAAGYKGFASKLKKKLEEKCK
ncbi:MAG: hypothetical protein DRP09_15490 [Candidatus Thorarchaeota archaeon]|nr:MAG: hypothetical protein DRP09_15490 [Candidatus Thorarchaeota archaeon]